MYCMYTSIDLDNIILLKSVCLSLFANCMSQFLLDCPGRYLKLFVSTVGPSSHEFAYLSSAEQIIIGKKHPMSPTILALNSLISARKMAVIRPVHMINTLEG